MGGDQEESHALKDTDEVIKYLHRGRVRLVYILESYYKRCGGGDAS
jgi:hypothetical protein